MRAPSAAVRGGAARPASTRILPVLLLTLGIVARSAAQEGVTVRFDNDILALRGTGAPPDHDYTHGLHVSVGFGAEGGRRSLGLGQRIYTPRVDGAEPVAGERPYAAWLFASAGAERRTQRRRRAVAVEVGVTGPPALGEPVQNGFHRLMGSARQEGWAHQLAFEPGVLVRLDERVQVRTGPLGVHSGWGVSLGNVRTGAHLTAGARLARADGSGAYVSTAVQQEWVARDLFLDGNTFRGGSPVRKRPLVRHAEAGVGYARRGWSAEYRFTARSREYHGQPGGHAFGSLVVTAGRTGR